MGKGVTLHVNTENHEKSGETPDLLVVVPELNGRTGVPPVQKGVS